MDWYQQTRNTNDPGMVRAVRDALFTLQFQQVAQRQRKAAKTPGTARCAACGAVIPVWRRSQLGRPAYCRGKSTCRWRAWQRRQRLAAQQAPTPTSSQIPQAPPGWTPENDHLPAAPSPAELWLIMRGGLPSRSLARPGTHNQIMTTAALERTRACAWSECGRVFVPKTSRSEYCSDACRAQAFRSRARSRTGGPAPRSPSVRMVVPHAADLVPPAWDPPSEPRHAHQTTEVCPECGETLLAGPRGTWRACAGCSRVSVPAAVCGPYAHGEGRHVASQRERDLEAIALAQRKGIMLAQLAALAADDKLDPASLPVVEWFRDQVRDAPGDGRLDALAGLLPEAGIRRRRWWQGQPAAITAGYAEDDEDQDDEPPPAQLAVVAAPAARRPEMTWAGAVAACGWRLSPVTGGCQVTETGRPCGAEVRHSITGGWVCARHHAALCQVLADSARRPA